MNPLRSACEPAYVCSQSVAITLSIEMEKTVIGDRRAEDQQLFMADSINFRPARHMLCALADGTVGLQKFVDADVFAHA